jgi:hypothetical protein
MIRAAAMAVASGRPSVYNFASECRAMPRSPKSPKPSKPDQAPRKRPAAPPQPAGSAGKTAGTEDEKKAPARRIEIPLISTPNDQIEMEREMEELFNEEKVKHHHGGTEPERD